MNLGKWVLFSFGALALTGLGYVAGARHSWKSTRSTAVVATVNGKSISDDDLDSALRLTGQPTLQKLVEQQIILQEASRLNIKLADEEMPPLDKVADIRSRRALELELRSQFLLRKILMRDVPEERKREVYFLFKDELTRYDISCIVLADRQESNLVQQAFLGGETFEKAAARYSKDSATKGKAGHLGYVSLMEIESRLGPRAADAVLNLNAGGTSSSLESPAGPVFIKVHSIRSSYDELRESVEALIAQSKQLETTYLLTRRTKVNYPGQTKAPDKEK